MPKFRKKPIVIEAVQLTWANWPEVCEFVEHISHDTFIGGIFSNDMYWWGEAAEGHVGDGVTIAAKIKTLDGEMIANENDWIIRGITGELYPCKPDIFDQTYELVS